jgi:lysophospholipase L1-like esterase
MSAAARRAAALAVAAQSAWLAACGGGGGGATPGPVNPGPVVPTHAVQALVYYDENGDGRLNADELVRLPGVSVRIGPAAGRTTAGGSVTVAAVPQGHQQASVPAEGLPPFYVPGPALDVDVPTSAPLELPVTLPIGGNFANRYMAFGDSITEGEGSGGERGYVDSLQDKLSAFLGDAELRREGIGGTTSEQGEARIGQRLARNRPAFTLILYGTNDWYECPEDDPPACFTVDALRSMVGQVKAAGSLPVLATIVPVNAGYDGRVPAARNDWLKGQNALIRTVASQEGAALADIEPAFYQAAGNDLAQLFSDHVHPNDRGYDVISDAFFRAITNPRTPPSSTSALPGLFSTSRRAVVRGARFPGLPPSRY